jgi:hypothetical protein
MTILTCGGQNDRRKHVAVRKGLIDGKDVEYFTASMAIDYLVDKSPRSKGGKTE